MIANELSPTFTPNKGSRPYQAFDKIFKLRNDLAHGKTVTISNTFEAPEGLVHANEYLRSWWEQECSPKNARVFYENAVEIVTDLFKRAGLDGHLYRASTSTWNSI